MSCWSTAVSKKLIHLIGTWRSIPHSCHSWIKGRLAAVRLPALYKGPCCRNPGGVNSLWSCGPSSHGALKDWSVHACHQSGPFLAKNGGGKFEPQIIIQQWSLFFAHLIKWPISFSSLFSINCLDSLLSSPISSFCILKLSLHSLYKIQSLNFKICTVYLCQDHIILKTVAET